ncbi:unnamed protein product [Didymodactylos carnosus]|uniref:Uncharacterized protein n=2 Tax=Didymodactylos carnosus TaxID=1234261 RepID=A0A8S2G344_9BILA|nr:unnamed protein product [Didymodactylos carnosus]CAF4439654.1 unnamed protein product [Didymodactylos carnosus]
MKESSKLTRKESSSIKHATQSKPIIYPRANGIQAGPLPQSPREKAPVIDQKIKNINRELESCILRQTRKPPPPIPPSTPPPPVSIKTGSSYYNAPDSLPNMSDHYNTDSSGVYGGHYAAVKKSRIQHTHT